MYRPTAAFLDVLTSLHKGGKITEEYSLIKSFAATVSTEVLNTIDLLPQTHKPTVEDDGMVRIQHQEHLE